MQVNRRREPALALDWQGRGACRDRDPELFFPVGVDVAALAQTDSARAVCAGCPVLGECLSWALSAPEEFGVWGGLSEQDRRAVRRSRKRLAKAADWVLAAELAQLSCEAGTPGVLDRPVKAGAEAAA